MAKSKLIKDTTRAEREEIIKLALAGCGNGSCDNEDLNRNGVLEVYANAAVEDANATGRLEPRKADVNISFVGSSTTNNDGQVVLTFAGSPLRLTEWTITDAQGARTRTQLTALQPASNLSARLFQLSDPTRRPGRN